MSDTRAEEIVTGAGGLLGLLVAACDASAARRQPFLALGAAIALLGALAGRRYRTETDLRTNVSVLTLADAADRDHAAETMRQLAERAGLERYMGGDAVPSSQALFALLTGHPCRLVQVQDFGPLLAAMAGRRAPPHRAAVWAALAALHGRAGGAYRDPAGAGGVVQQPCLCLNGLAERDSVRHCLSGSGGVETMLGRFLVFAAASQRPCRNRHRQGLQPSAGLLAALRRVSGPGIMTADHMTADHMTAGHMTAGQAPAPLTVVLSRAALALQDRCLDGEDRWAAQVIGTPAARIVERLGEHAARLALIRAISRDPVRPMIVSGDVDWGWRLAEYCTRSLLAETGAGAVLAASRHRQRVIGLIRAAGTAGLTRTALYRRTAFLGRQRDPVLDALIKAGLIAAERCQGRTKPVLRYRETGRGIYADPEP